MISLRTRIVCTAIIILLSCTTAPGENSVYLCRSIASAPLIDGNVNEAVWAQASWIDLKENTGGGSPAQTGRVAALWDEKFLYLAFDFQDRNILSSITTRDDRLWVQDVAEVFIAPSGNDRIYYEFQFSPLSNWRDVLILHRGIDSDFKALEEWNTEVQLQAQLRGTLENNRDEDQSWSIEVAIPLSDLWLADTRPPRPGNRWKINFYRIDYGEGEPELSAWCPTLKPTFHDPSSFGTIEFD